jgi:hypothetical protein
MVPGVAAAGRYTVPVSNPFEASERERRAANRRSWPVRKVRLGEEPGEYLSATTTPAERIGMMWRLAQDAWALSGRPISDYSREEMPITKRHLHDPPGDES